MPYVGSYSSSVAAALAGGALPAVGGSSESAALVPVTGQHACDSVGDGSGYPSPCPAGPVGQDGELQVGLPRSFTNNGDGTISDGDTGLMWEVLCVESPPGAACPPEHNVLSTYSWEEAFAKIDAMNAAGYAGYSDWRIPNWFELARIRNLARPDGEPAVDPVFEPESGGCVGPCSVTTPLCSCSREINYSSSTGATIYFREGSTFWLDRGAEIGVRAVRGRIFLW